MGRLSRRALLMSFLAVAVVSALLGGAIALVVFADEPEVIVREIVVEVEPLKAPLTPAPDDLSFLTGRYLELADRSESWTASLVEEIATSVCDADNSATQIMANFDQDISISEAQLEGFIQEVRQRCPEPTQ